MSSEIKFRYIITGANGIPMIEVFELPGLAAGNAAMMDHIKQGRKIEFAGQYTGIKDCEGVEIFAGDIVLFTYWWFDGNHAESELKGEIVYLPESMSFGLKGVKNKDWLEYIGAEEVELDTAAFATWLFDEADFQVIGNIYEHPELIEKE